MGVNKRLLTSLLKKADTFYGGGYAGVSYRDIERYGSYEEAGLKLVSDDIELTQLYAGLAVFSSELHSYLKQSPREDAAWFEEVISSVHSEEQRLYGPGAFPYDDPAFPHRAELDAFPKGLAPAADQGHPTVIPLGKQAILHEWTVKPGKRLFIRFGLTFKEVICGTSSPYEQFENRLLNQATLPGTIATTILTHAISPATLWYPLAIYLALLITRTGLKMYCEPEYPKRANKDTKSAEPPDHQGHLS
jgi:hypothetical protein